MKHAKKNLFGLGAIAVAIFALAAVPFFAQLNAQNANADELSSQDCAALSSEKKAMEYDILQCYDAFGKSQNYGYGFTMISNLLSDDCIAGGGVNDGPQVQSIDQICNKVFNWETGAVEYLEEDRNLFNTEWINYYDTIRLCNTFIEKWQVDEISQPYVAEAYCLRAMCYFDLVRLFGRIPLVCRTTDSMDFQSDPEVVMIQVLSDFSYAFTKSDYGTKYSSANCTRCSKVCAGAYLARAYCFYEGFYKKVPELAPANPEAVPLVFPSEIASLSKADVVKILEDVINNGQISLTDDYRRIFASNIMSYREEYSFDPKTAETLEELIGELNSDYGYSDQDYVFSVRFNSKTYKDKNNMMQKLIGPRLASQDYRYQGYGMLSVSRSFYEDWQKIEPSDVRFNNSIVDLGKEVTDTETWNLHLEDWRECTGLIPAKYAPLSYYDETNTGFAQDIVLMRVSDLYMMHSELTGDMTQFNRVRERAGLSPVGYSWINIQNERRFEFAFEGYRYWDLLRWSGKDFNNSSLICTNIEKQNGSDIITAGEKTKLAHLYSSWADRLVMTQGYMPIPEAQLKLHPEWRQNRGWEKEEVK